MGRRGVRDYIVLLIDLTLLFSVRAGIRNGDNDYIVTAHSWPTFVYADFTSDPDDIEKGLFKSAFLVKVCTSKMFIYSMLIRFPHTRHLNIYSHHPPLLLTMICWMVTIRLLRSAPRGRQPPHTPLSQHWLAWIRWHPAPLPILQYRYVLEHFRVS